MITIWGRTNSHNVKKVLWLAEELGLDFVRHDVGGAFGYPDDYISKNPNRLVPTLEDGDLVLWKSNGRPALSGGPIWRRGLLAAFPCPTGGGRQMDGLAVHPGRGPARGLPRHRAHDTEARDSAAVKRASPRRPVCGAWRTRRWGAASGYRVTVSASATSGWAPMSTPSSA